MLKNHDRIAIATGKLGAVSETFISRHINKLNNGNTIIICNKVDDASKYDNKIYVEKVLYNWHNYPKPIRKVLRLSQSIRFGYKRIPDKKERKSIQRFLITNRVKIILAEFGTHGCMMLPIAKPMGIPVYTYFRGFDASEKLKDWKIRYSYRRLIPQMEGIFAVSPHLLDNLSNIGVKWKQAHVIPSGTDVEKFRPTEKDRHLILGVGRFVSKKAPDITIRAFAKVKEGIPNAKLVMVGDGPLFENCRALAHSLGIEKSVNFAGAQNHDVVSNLMAKTSLFVIHSVMDENGNTEGFPSVIQEAMSAGAVTISTRHGGIPHFVKHGETGMLVDEYDVDAYAAYISKLLKDQSLREKMSKNARTYAMQHFDYRKLYNKIEKIMGIRN
ncbi:glycosyltransferase [Natronogracilivirga saccharolytica]|uniref:Glycosyltransferase n=1 Tax=Natronogracilivirga saccharolytica TaxID=2812953 RepID=A0A8J7RM82_9BACT|nr:glycosyltransferase [Natronogracilivirga saccharolytica]MBP3193957.1 glycosyltransferase [Natronogracilivirga saccharolytica]